MLDGFIHRGFKSSVKTRILKLGKIERGQATLPDLRGFHS
jgi:hypothetical protein